jgi:hypothetical protein
MEYVFKIVTKKTYMEAPLKNSEESKRVYAEINDTFEEDVKNGSVFKLLSGNLKEVVLEYDRHYLVKNEHKGYDFSTTLRINEPKQITSMWGPVQTTITITYLGIFGENYIESENVQTDNYN